MSGDESVLISKVTNLKGARRVERYDGPYVLGNARSGMCYNNRFEVVFPNRIPILVAIGGPVAGPHLKVDDRNVIFLKCPRYGDDLLNEGEEPDISLTDNVKSFGSGREIKRGRHGSAIFHKAMTTLVSGKSASYTTAIKNTLTPVRPRLHLTSTGLVKQPTFLSSSSIQQ